MTNLISARQRWAHSHFIRTSIISNILEESGMTRKEDVSHHLIRLASLPLLDRVTKSTGNYSIRIKTSKSRREAR